jgi:hypothetical protein
MTEPPTNRDNAIVEGRLAELIARYGERWSETELTLIRTRIGRSITLGEALRGMPMSNADEPGNVFKPYREETVGQ